MPRAGRKRKKRRTEKDEDESDRKAKQTPRCFVLKRGTVGDRVKDLVHDLREVMMPNTAMKLRESKLNRIEDYIAVAGHYNVSHLIILTVTKVATWLKLTKLPQGPTLTFRVDSFSLARDVKASQRRPRGGARDYTVAPLQVLNGFSGGSGSSGSGKGGTPTDLTAEMLRGLFPPVDVREFNHAECRRTALFQYEKEDDAVFFRHYSVGRKTAGLQRGVSKLLRRARLPKLGRCEDISDFVLGGGQGASESEMEDVEEVPIVGGGRTAIKLVETGPRLKLTLVKAEEGVMGGTVLYHRFTTRTPTQIEVNAENARKKRKFQERNEKLSAMAKGFKATKKLLDKKKEERRAQKGEKGASDKAKDDAAESDAEGRKNDAEDVGGGKKQRVSKAGGEDVDDATGEIKKKRFHPFGWGAKKTREANAGGQNTVDIDTSKQARHGKGGEKGGKSKGKGKGGKSKGKGKGKGKGGKPKMGVMDKFRRSGK